MGVLPVPPTERFPTQMMGKLNDTDLKIFLSYNLFRSQIIMPYKIDNGNKTNLKLLSINYFLSALYTSENSGDLFNTIFANGQVAFILKEFFLA